MILPEVGLDGAEVALDDTAVLTLEVATMELLKEDVGLALELMAVEDEDAPYGWVA